MINEKFVYLGVLISVGGGLSYVVATLKGKTKPNRVSWFLWFLAPMIAFASQIKQGVHAQALLTFTAGFNPLLVLIATFVSRKSVWKIGPLDIVCGLFSVLGIVFWLGAKQANAAIMFSILADAMAAIPTVVKSYKEPESESSTAFLCGAISALLTLLTIKTWNFQTYAFSTYIFIICVILFSLITVRPYLIRRVVIKPI